MPSINSIPVPPPLPLPALSRKKIELKKAEHDARAVGVPSNISERELCEANERINAVEAAKKNQREKEDVKEAKEQDLMEIETEIKGVEAKVKDIETKLIKLDSSFAEQMEKMKELPSFVKERLFLALMEPFENLKAATSALESENIKLARLNSKRSTLKDELSEIIKKINAAAQELLEAEKKLMPADSEKAKLFNAIKAEKKEVENSKKPEESNADKKEELEKFCKICSERKIIKDEIEKLEGSKCDDKVVKLGELKKRLESNEKDYQYALRSGQSAINYAISSKKTNLRNTLSDKSELPGFFQKPNANTRGSEEAASKCAMQLS